MNAQHNVRGSLSARAALRPFAAVAVLFSLAVVPGPTGTPQVSAGPPTPGCVIDTAGLIGWWRGQDSLVAEVGPSMVGTVGYADAAVRRGMQFGATSRLQASGLATVTDGLTVEMWVRPTAMAFTGKTQTLAGRWDFPGVDDSARSYLLLLDPFANLVWSTDEPTSRRPLELRASAPQLFDGSFHHVAATWSTTTVTIHVDGVQIASEPSQRGVLNAASATAFRLGSKDGLGDVLGFDGIIDDAAVFSRALSMAEIAAIHGAGANGKCTPTPSQAKVSAADAASNDGFGYEVAIDAGTVVVGSASAGAGPGSGSAYVFTGAGTAWGQQAELVAADADPADSFGDAVAIDANTVVIGAPGDDGGAADAGAAYVFTRTGSTWTQQAKLLAGDAAPNDTFGSSVAIDADTIVVGAIGEGGDFSGAVYVFTRSGTAWTQQAKLRAADAAAIDLFGQSVSLLDNTIAVGAPNDSNSVSFAGSAYVFTRTGSEWAQRAKIVAPDAAVGDFFGWSVSLTGGALLATAYAADDQRGAAYVFQGSGATWTQQARLQAADGAAGDLFGIAGFIDGDTFVAGAPLEADGGELSGAAYVFRRSGSTWTQRAKLVSPSPAVGDTFGSAVSISGDVVAVGTPGADPPVDAGSVHLFTNP